MATEIKDNIIFGESVEFMDFDNHIVKTASGENYNAKMIISTIPWTSIKIYKGLPLKLCSKIAELKYSSIETRYFGQNLDTDAQWIYYPDENLPFHRILVRKNFFPGSNGYWTETNTKRLNLFGGNNNSFKFINEYAYPLNTLNKPMIMNDLLSWTKKHSVIGIGRWGEWQHYNSDVTVGRALEFVKSLNL